MYKEDLVLKNLQGFIYHTKQPNQIFNKVIINGSFQRVQSSKRVVNIRPSKSKFFVPRLDTNYLKIITTFFPLFHYQSPVFYKTLFRLGSLIPTLKMKWSMTSHLSITISSDVKTRNQQYPCKGSVTGFKFLSNLKKGQLLEELTKFSITARWELYII